MIVGLSFLFVARKPICAFTACSILYLILLFAPIPARANQVTAKKAGSKIISLSQAISVDPRATCLEHATLVREVGKWLEKNTIDRRIRIEVEGSRSDPDKAMFTIYKGDKFPNRSYFDSTADLCAEFHSALGLSIAMAINATFIEPPPKEGEAGPGYDQRSLFAAQLLGSYSILPGVAPGIQAYFESWYHWIALRAGIMGFLTFDQSINDDINGKFDATAIAGYIDICTGEKLIYGLRFVLCAGVSGGQFRTEGTNDDGSALVRTESRTFPWAAPSLGGSMAYELSDWIEVAVSADLFVSLWSRTIQVTYFDETPAARKDLPLLGVTIGIGPVFSIR
ncbi:MAG: hypothetical protein JXA30_16905 [Deltaproteobacteria bacterium]|nr:hypothetical protein [Deltaproteobacteria bacterium]